MKPKTIFKLVVDVVMTILLLLLMSFELIGRTAHEWMGLGIFVLFFTHLVLNRKWLGNLLKGNYSPMRVFQTAVAALVMLSMLGAMVSALMLSREIFHFLPLHGGTSFARVLHMLAAYWGFLFMSVHLGLHWSMILGILRKMTGSKKASAVRTWILRALALAVSGFGICAFFRNHIADYLFLRSHFVFFDIEQPLAVFLAEYVAMMTLWACVGFYGAKALQKCTVKKHL